MMTTPSFLRLAPARAGFLDWMADLTVGFALARTASFFAGLADLMRFAVVLRAVRFDGTAVFATFGAADLAGAGEDFGSAAFSTAGALTAASLATFLAVAVTSVAV
ncbi:MAG TPA: hypothetical protein VFO69_06790 [Allosphingosinicella sp.]|nr:hypothetical protein [Allosphingosinicella sp.]